MTKIRATSVSRRTATLTAVEAPVTTTFSSKATATASVIAARCIGDLARFTRANRTRLRRERRGPRPYERAGEPGEHRQVGAQPRANRGRAARIRRARAADPGRRAYGRI